MCSQDPFVFSFGLLKRHFCLVPMRSLLGAWCLCSLWMPPDQCSISHSLNPAKSLSHHHVAIKLVWHTVLQQNIKHDLSPTCMLCFVTSQEELLVPQGSQSSVRSSAWGHAGEEIHILFFISHFPLPAKKISSQKSFFPQYK